MPPADPPPLDPYADNLWLEPGRRDDPVVDTVDPRWAPPASVERPTNRPTSRLTHWLPSVVIVVAFALSAGGLWAIAHVSRGVDVPSSAFLPADGASWYGDLDRGGAVSELETVNESSRLGALEATQSLSFNYGAKLLGALDGGGTDQLGAARAWRVTSTEIGAGAARIQRVRTYRTDRGIELMADSGPDGAQVYTPALRELPADPKPGQSWQSDGHTLDGGSYLSDFTTSAASSAKEAGCLNVRGSIAFSGSTTGSGREIAVERTWCPGRGLVRSSERIGGAAVTEVIIDPSPPAPGAAEVDLAGPAYAWQHPAGWTGRSTEIRSPDPDSGDSALAALPGPVPPVALASGLLVRAVTQGSDLVVLSPPTALEDSWQVVRRLHPGGAVTMLASYGNLVLVGTTDRRLIAYAPDGQRAWQTEFNDIVTTVPARSGDAVAAISASGELRMIDLRTGATRWRVDRRADVSAPPTADDDTVVVADRSGELTAYAARDAAVRWNESVEDAVASMIINAGSLQLVQGSDFDTRDLENGTLRSRKAVPGTFRALRGVGDLAVLTSTGITEAVDPAGRLAWTAGGYGDLTTDGRVLIGWRNDGADVVSATGAVLGRYDLGPLRNSENRQYVRYRQGVLVCSTVFNDIGVWS